MIPEDIRGWFPSDFSQLAPGQQLVLIILLTFVSEDLTCIGSAVLYVSGSLSFWVAWGGSFLGIWIGDIGLYVGARLFGEPLRRWRFSARWIQSERVRRAEEWFQKRGVLVLWFCRWVPGTRLPTYLAAGLVRLPVLQFVSVTGVAALLWTGVVFGATRVLGVAVGDWLAVFERGIVGVLATVLVLFGLIKLVQRSAWWRRNLGGEVALQRWLRWEFWPAWFFYLPIGAWYAWLTLKYRGLTLPTASNPGIETGGMIGESKVDLLRELHRVAPEYTAAAFPIEGDSATARWASFETVLQEQGLEYPLIVKPDVGQRGSGVRLVRDAVSARHCLESDGYDQIVQTYAPGPEEAGVFYYRFPEESHGRIFGITHKVFPAVVGDGRQTLGELIESDERARLMTPVYTERFGERMAAVIPEGETIRLVQAGNHAQGCIFRDGAFLFSEALERRIDAISQAVDGFFIGRYDIRYASPEALRAGTDFQIVELNGAAAEATQVYDPDNRLRDAYRTLFEQWEIVFRIGAANRRLGVRPDSVGQLWRYWWDYQSASRGHARAD